MPFRRCTRPSSHSVCVLHAVGFLMLRCSCTVSSVVATDTGRSDTRRIRFGFLPCHMCAGRTNTSQLGVGWPGSTCAHACADAGYVSDCLSRDVLHAWRGGEGGGRKTEVEQTCVPWVRCRCVIVKGSCCEAHG